ncbi:MAG: hypothetical protein ABW182_13355 [Sphingomonas sp.]
MNDRDHYRMRADAERKAAYAARDAASCRIHMAIARDYEFRAAMEPREPDAGEVPPMPVHPPRREV